MIKLICSDLDGTLLDEKKRLPEEIFSLVEQLYERGVTFMPASGRQYHNLAILFAPVKDKILFSCENGALVKQRDKTLYCNPVPDGEIKGVLDAIRAIPHVCPMLCGEKSAYIENKTPPFYEEAHRFYTSCIDVDNLDDVIGKEPICKIAIYDELGSANNCILHLPQKLPRLRTALSGEFWCDVSSPTANKGTAIAFLREKFSLAKEECVAFGDHMNDYEMLLECGQSYVTENAFPPLKEKIKRTIPSNAEGGVLTKIKEIIKQIDGEEK